jgi:hypothetical protein
MPQIYNQDLVGKKLSVVDEILLLNPNQTPLINLLGFAAPVTQTSHTWYEDEVFAVSSTATAAKLATDTAIVVADVEPFRANQVVKIGDEFLLVTAVDTVGKSLTVQRGYAGTTAAAIANNAEVEVQFVESVEGLDARDARYKKRVAVSNFTQLFDDTIKITGTAQAVTQYGIGDLYEYEKQKKQLELALALEKALIGGIAYENGNVRYMKGIRNFIQSNITNAGGSALTDDLINDAAQAIYEKGGFAGGGEHVIMVPAKQKRAISDFGKANIRLERLDNGRGSVADFFTGDFGRFEIVLNQNLNSDELIIMDKNRAKIRPLNEREFFHKYLGETGDHTDGILVGEYTLEFNQEKAHARIKGLA